jgi:small-conductance mechanosensitive channel
MDASFGCSDTPQRFDRTVRRRGQPNASAELPAARAGAIIGVMEQGTTTQDGVEEAAVAPTGTTETGQTLGEWASALVAEVQEDPLRSRLVLGLGILVGSWLAARVLDFLLVRVVRRWTRSTTTTFDDQVVQWIHRPLIGSAVCLGIWGAASVIAAGSPAAGSVGTIGKVALTIVLLLVASFLFRSTGLFVRTASESRSRFRIIETRTLPLFDNLSKLGLFALASWAFFVIWSIPVTGWIASAGIAGIAIGFAAQDTLSNLFAGVFIIADAPYNVGDYVNLDSGERGQVRHIGLRSTRLLTRDDVEVTIPNSVMGGARIINESAGPSPKHRVRVQVSVAYGSDVAQVREVLLAAKDGVDNVCAEPAPRVRFRTFGASGLDFELLCWIPHPELRGRVLDALNTSVYDALRAADIEIPYPKRDVYVRELPGPVNTG